MNKLLIVILIVSIIGNLIGLFVLYKFWNLKGYFAEIERQNRTYRGNIENLNKEIADLTGRLDQYADNRMVFLHHSVGKALLNDGGLRDQLLDMGILVKSATYGDSIGEDTDMNHWVKKFRDRMDEVLHFRNHPNQYYQGDTTDDIVMFKSCFPNSNIVAEGDGEGDPFAAERTIANYRTTFEELQNEMQKHPNKLFIYMTAPPLHPDATTLENAARARKFNDWLLKVFQPEYVEQTGLHNFYVFDLFGALSDDNNVLKKEYLRDRDADSHPNYKGSKEAVDAFIKFFRPIRIKWQNRQEKT